MSKETRNLYQRAFVRLRFVSEPTVQSDAGNAEFGSGPAFAIFGFTEVAFQGKKYVSRINAPVCSRTLRIYFRCGGTRCAGRFGHPSFVQESFFYCLLRLVFHT